MKIQVFWVTTLCHLVGSCQLFRGACGLLDSGYIQGVTGGKDQTSGECSLC